MLSAKGGSREEAGDQLWFPIYWREVKKSLHWEAPAEKSEVKNCQEQLEGLLGPRREECCGIDHKLLESALLSPACFYPGKNNSIPEYVECWTKRVIVGEKRETWDSIRESLSKGVNLRNGEFTGYFECQLSILNQLNFCQQRKKKESGSM